MLGQRRERRSDHRVRGWSDAAKAKEHLEPPDDRKGKEGFSERLERAWPLELLKNPFLLV